MRAVGETMALGGNYREALQKALRGLETGLMSLELKDPVLESLTSDRDKLSHLKERLKVPEPERLSVLYQALKLGLTREEAVDITTLDPWFIIQMELILETERYIQGDFAKTILSGVNPQRMEWIRVKSQGFSDAQISQIVNSVSLSQEKSTQDSISYDNLSKEKLNNPENLDNLDNPDYSEDGDKQLEIKTPSKHFSPKDIGILRERVGVIPHFKQVDTCAGEFLAETPYFYSTYDSPESPPEIGDPVKSSKKVMILGGGPNRIGQGIEFDYCCVKAAQAFLDMGYRTIMVNSNPETVSTDYDAVGRLYFEPVTLEDVLAICKVERPDGVIVQLGGQTPLNLAMDLKEAGVPIWGTPPEAIFRAEDRHGWNELVNKLKLSQPPGDMAFDEKSALKIAEAIGYPVIVRPSFVLGGRYMRIIAQPTELALYVKSLTESGLRLSQSNPILVDKFLDDAVEVDVDAVADGTMVVIAAIMEHIERAGVHSGDSSCCIPPFSLAQDVQKEIRRQTELLGLELGVKGLMNIQYAVKDSEVYVLEANPRASRTAPYVAKATGRALIEAAAGVMAGRSLKELKFLELPPPSYYAVKEAVIPWGRFVGSTVLLGPEMHSTGEVMGIDQTFGHAFLKASIAAGSDIPLGGEIIMTVADRDKDQIIEPAKTLRDMGFTFLATPGTGKILKEHGIEAGTLYNINVPRKPNVLEYLKTGKARMFVNTAQDSQSIRDSSILRAEAIARGVPIMTTLAGLNAMVEALISIRKSRWIISPLQDYHSEAPSPRTPVPA
jgi:carbamoyl-phosphate synthase large subunit